MNDQVEGTAKDALKNMKKLERNTKNMVAAQNSKFLTSKYQASKYVQSVNMSKMSKFSITKINQQVQND